MAFTYTDIWKKKLLIQEQCKIQVLQNTMLVFFVFESRTNANMKFLNK